MIPFEAPLEYSAGGQIYFPWFSFWRSNPLSEKRLSLFVTVVEEVLLQDPDLDSAVFQILDFSRPESGPRPAQRTAENERRLLLVDAREIPRLDDHEMRSMLEVFAEGYRKARDELEGVKSEKRRSGDLRKPDPAQGDFFGFEPDC